MHFRWGKILMILVTTSYDSGYQITRKQWNGSCHLLIAFNYEMSPILKFVTNFLNKVLHFKEHVSSNNYKFPHLYWRHYKKRAKTPRTPLCSVNHCINPEKLIKMVPPLPAVLLEREIFDKIIKCISVTS